MPFKVEFKEVEREIAGQKVKIRELSVGDQDTAADAAKGPDGNIDARTMMRIMVVRSLVEPKVTLEEVSALPFRVYTELADAVNDLNYPPEDTDEGND